MNLLKNYKWTLLIISVFLGSLFLLIEYAYQKEVPISEKEAVFTGNVSGFVNDSIVENSVIVLKAVVSSIKAKEIVLENSISIQYDNSENKNFKAVNLGDLITVKGIYLGYDDLFEEYKLINCILLNDE
ncbi:hypothetical protein OAA78_00470 [Flavobacteriaceae bacterium]|jgi:hypothetical protein|nr:hypothetical protein [Flavobacteriaceae bacterium]MDC1492882.1 hypothetical protein [Flavobacteriaceae bacterium]